MASVQDLKDILITEQSRLAEISEKSISATSGVYTVASFVIVVFATALAVLAFVGWRTIQTGAVAKSKALTQERINAYLCSDEHKKVVAESIHAYMQNEWQNKILSPMLDKHDKSNVEASPFPEYKKKGV